MSIEWSFCSCLSLVWGLQLARVLLLTLPYCVGREHRFIQAQLLTGCRLWATSMEKHQQTGRGTEGLDLSMYLSDTDVRHLTGIKLGKKQKSLHGSLPAPDEVQKHTEPLVILENPATARYLWNAHVLWSYQSLSRVCCRVSSFDHGLGFPAIFLSAPIRGKSGNHEKAGWSQ